MFQTLQEALEANSLEHKLEMQIKASLDDDVNEAAYIEGEDYSTEPISEILKLGRHFPYSINVKNMFGASFVPYCKKYLNTDKPFYLTDEREYFEHKYRKALNKLTEIEYLLDDTSTIAKHRGINYSLEVLQFPNSHNHFIVIYDRYTKWYLFV